MENRWHIKINNNLYLEGGEVAALKKAIRTIANSPLSSGRAGSLIFARTANVIEIERQGSDGVYTPIALAIRYQ